MVNISDILWFKEIDKNSLNFVGGKGLNLGLMYAKSFPVPPGFVVTTDAYKKFLKETNIEEKVYSTLDNLDVEDADALYNAAEKVQNLILNAKMSPSTRVQILEAYENLNVDLEVLRRASKQALEIIKAGREKSFVAIRSSATAEDLGSISENEYVFVKLNNKPFFGKMRELVSIVNTENIIFVPAMDNNFEVKWKRVSHITQHKTNDNKLFKITTATGKHVTISTNHTLIVLDDETLQPKVTSIAELKGNEKVPVIKNIPGFESIDAIDILDFISKKEVVEHDNKIMIKNQANNWKIQQGLPRKIKITKDFAYFLGLYTAEGSTYGNNCVMVTNSNTNIINKVKRFLKTLGINSENKINKHTLRVYCKTLTRLLNENCSIQNRNIRGKGKTCRTKEVPSFIFSCSKEIIGEYLKGCFDGDGSVDKKTVSYSSTSEKLIAGISTLLELLNIEFYIGGGNSCFEINLPTRESEKFKNNIGFFHNKKVQRLNILINKYNRAKKHHESKNSIFISKNLASNIRDLLEEKFPKQKIEIALCPLCIQLINKSSRYKNKERYHCPACKKTFYADKTIKKVIEKYVNYNEKGRFLKESIPWNKSINTYPNYGINKFKEILTNNGAVQLLKVFSDSIVWDKIVKIEEINYGSFVYDFSVPDVENFAAGMGGVITHNSASFAGQQASFLNVKGDDEVIKSVQKCWASLFTSRAIYYRVKNNFDHRKVFIAVVVQKMINSEKSGVVFTKDPNTGENEIIIEAVFGLGETIVSGSVTPDHYVVDPETMQIKVKKIEKQSFKLIRESNLGKNIKRNLGEEGSEQKLTNAEIIKLADICKEIEEYYRKPQDIEFAVESGRIYIVQSRPVTTIGKKVEEKEKGKIQEEIKEEKNKEILLRGFAASPHIGSGKVKIIHGADELNKIEIGDILVTEMTNPDYVTVMKKASGIVTDEGGSTCHAAIVSRELEIPCVVGTEKATKILKDHQEVTVDGINGKVYAGILTLEEPKEEIILKKSHEKEEYDTVTKVKVNLDMPDMAKEASETKADGIGLLRAEFLLSRTKEHPAWMIKNGKKDQLINELVNGISGIAQYFKGKPIWYRTSDMRTDEYRDLYGGEAEPKEDNPMMGWHGIRRSLDEIEFLRAEFEAIKKVHEMGFTNVGVMLPMVISVDEVRKAKELINEIGLEPLEEIEFGVMVETPAAVQVIDEICKEGIDFISFGSNDLTQLTLGLDRNNAKIQHLWSEMHPAVLREIGYVIKICRENNVETSICGQAGSNPEMVEFLVKKGI
ncbi:MAG: phosphoenolpyruvate synthase, partial [Nanoarchaeota archaeon]